MKEHKGSSWGREGVPMDSIWGWGLSLAVDERDQYLDLHQLRSFMRRRYLAKGLWGFEEKRA